LKIFLILLESSRICGIYLYISTNKLLVQSVVDANKLILTFFLLAISF